MPSLPAARATLALALALAVGASACSSDDDGATTTDLGDASGDTANHDASTSDADPSDALDAGAGDTDDVPDAHDVSDADGADVATDADTDDATADASDVPDATDTDADTDIDTPDASTGPWRSALYPDDWAPGFATDDGHFLHDFSYAGYRRGEQAIPDDRPGVTIDVDVDTTGAMDATAAIQAALDTVAESGGVVQLPEGLVRIDGGLVLHGNGVVLRGAGRDSTRLWFTDTTLGDGGAHLRLGPYDMAGDRPRLPALQGAPIAITAAGDTWDTAVEVETTEGLAAGDLVTIGWVITPDFIADHGMTGTWVVFLDQRATFFRREIVAVDADTNRVHLDIPLRTPFTLRDTPTLTRIEHAAREVGVESLSVATAIDEPTAWAHDRQAAIELIGVVDGWVRDIGSFAPPGVEPDPDGVLPHLRSGGIRVTRSSRVTVADSHLAHPQNRGGGGNGYLFEILQVGEVLTVDSTADRGRHNFIQNWGFGTTGCVWLRVHTTGGAAATGGPGSFESPGLSEFHHSLATANLIDAAVIDDGWGAVNRGAWSSGAGHSAHQNVVWAATGEGVVNWFNYGDGYVIGTGPDLDVFTALPWFGGDGTEPADTAEGLGRVDTLEPPSLYDDQLGRRLARDGRDD